MQSTLLLAMIGCTVVANLLMKMGHTDRPNPLLLNVISTRTLLGLVAFGCAAVLYTLILKVLPLNVAQSFAAVQFVAVICAATLILGEPIGIGRWMGIALIAAGIFVVALSNGAKT